VTSGSAGSALAATVGTASNSQIAVGTDIRQNAIYLTVALSSGNAAELDRVASQIKFQPLAAPVDAAGEDFLNLFGREGQVEAAREALAKPRSVAVFGGDGIGKSVFLRHLARRAGGRFPRGVALLATGGSRWQDVGQEVVQSFYEAAIPVYLGPAQLRRLLSPIDALVLLDDVATNADIGQLSAMLTHGKVVVASTQRLLAGDTRAIRLEGLDNAACVALVQSTLDDLGLTTFVDSANATRIGRALGGHPSRIVGRVTEADGRHITLAQLADELEASGGVPALTQSLTPDQQAVVAAVASLDGAPVGPEHIAAVTGVPPQVVEDLAQGRRLRAASPQLRLGVEVAAAADDVARDLDEIRERFLGHFVRWTHAHREDPAAVGEEYRAIQALLRWADGTGRYPEVLALAEAVDAGLSATGHWGAWSEATQYRLRAAEAVGDGRQAVVAHNQMGVQALGDDEAERARDLFAVARDRADVLGLSSVSEIADRNRRLVDSLLGPPTDHGPKKDDGNGGGHPPPQTPWPALVTAIVIVVAVVAALFLTNRKAIAIEPANRVFDAATVDADGELVSFRVTNQGAAQLDALDVRLTGESADSFFIVGGDCPGLTLAAGASCTVEVLFHPVRTGEVQAILSVTAGDGTAVVASIDGTSAPVTPGPTLPPTPTPSASPTPIETERPLLMPDIVIEAFAPTDIPRRGEDLVAVPVLVAIKNVGEGSADRFPIVITADGVPVPFRAPDEDHLRLVTDAPLAPGETFTYEASVYLDSRFDLSRVDLVVAADSCDARGATPNDCPVKDAKPLNNSYQLQAADIVVSPLTIGVPRETFTGGIFLPPNVEVDISFEVVNTGIAPSGQFWIAAFQGQSLRILNVDGATFDEVRGMPEVPSLEPGTTTHLSGTVSVPRKELSTLLVITGGCPVGAGPCAVPEIALDNNEAYGFIPLPPEPTPTPTAPPVVIY
jgi:hypothetical protein